MEVFGPRLRIGFVPHESLKADRAFEMGQHRAEPRQLSGAGQTFLGPLHVPVIQARGQPPEHTGIKPSRDIGHQQGVKRYGRGRFLPDPFPLLWPWRFPRISGAAAALAR